MFYRGQKVVCVREAEDVPPNCFGGKVGQIYTIRALLEDPIFGGVDGIWLEEIVNPNNPFWQDEWGLDIRRFRPAVNHKTDISVFKKMLVDANSKIPA